MRNKATCLLLLARSSAILASLVLSWRPGAGKTLTGAPGWVCVAGYWDDLLTEYAVLQEFEPEIDSSLMELQKPASTKDEL